MPGRPKFAADLKRLTEEPSVGAELLQLIGAGKTVVAAAAQLGLVRAAAMEWLDSTEETRAAWSRARAQGGIAMAEHALTLADDCIPGDEPLARIRIGARQWLAERYNREILGAPKTGVQVQLNIGGLHLAALQRQPVPMVERIDEQLSIEEQLMRL